MPRDLVNLEPLMRDNGNGLRVYLVLLARASHKPRLAQGSHGAVSLERGQCVCGIREIAELLDVGHDTAHRALKKLERLGLITRKAGQRGSVVSLVNYGAFERIEETPSDSSEDSTEDTPKDSTEDSTEDLSNRLTVTTDQTGVTEKSSSPSAARPDKQEPNEALSLADRLRDHILARLPGYRECSAKRWPTTRTRWAKDLRLAREQDDRSWADLGAVIDWSQADAFWAPNILSGKKVREKFDQLEAKRIATPANAGPRHHKHTKADTYPAEGEVKL